MIHCQLEIPILKPAIKSIKRNLVIVYWPHQAIFVLFTCTGRNETSCRDMRKPKKIKHIWRINRTICVREYEHTLKTENILLYSYSERPHKHKKHAFYSRLHSGAIIRFVSVFWVISQWWKNHVSVSVSLCVSFTFWIRPENQYYVLTIFRKM